MAEPANKKKPAGGKASKASGAGKGGGELVLSLGNALRPALWAGIPTLILVLWCLYGWQDKPVLRHPFTAEHGRHLALIGGGLGLVAAVGWVLLPLAHWVRRYPAERFASGNKVAWLVPLLAATPVWIALYVATIGCLVLAGAAVIDGLLELGLVARWHALAG
jgi:hypothetical protein